MLVPELVYVRDAFDGGGLYRMNTVFKLGYQGVAAGWPRGSLPWAAVWLPWRGLECVGGRRRDPAPARGSSIRTPAAYARTGGFSNRPTLKTA